MLWNHDVAASILAWPADKVVMAHADPVLENGRSFIERAFRWLMD